MLLCKCAEGRFGICGRGSCKEGSISSKGEVAEGRVTVREGGGPETSLVSTDIVVLSSNTESSPFWNTRAPVQTDHILFGQWVFVSWKSLGRRGGWF